jgi:hypothetical protein
MRLFVGILALSLAVAGAAQTSSTPQQQPSSPQAGSSSAQGNSTETTAKQVTGGRTVIGCVTQSGGEYVLKTEEDSFPLNTDRDLSPYVGKKVKIEGEWEATGVTTTAPVAASGSKTAKEPATSSAQSAPAFGGDLHLRIVGHVIGDCSPAQK